MKEKTHIVRTHYKGQTDFTTYLKNCNRDFVIKTTSSSTTIEYSDNYGKCKRIFCDGLFMSIKEMILQKKLKKQIKELDRIGEQQYHLMSPIEQKGYRNFMKLIKAAARKAKPEPR